MNSSNNLHFLSTDRKLSPTSSSRLTVDSSIIDKDEGISDEEDPAELRVLLDLNEQESSQLRRKVDELEQENKTIKTQLKEIREAPKTPTTPKKLTGTAKDKEIAELQKKLIDMEKNVELLKKNSTKTGAQSKADEKKAAQESRVLNEKVDSLNSEISKLRNSKRFLTTFFLNSSKQFLNTFFSSLTILNAITILFLRFFSSSFHDFICHVME